MWDLDLVRSSAPLEANPTTTTSPPPPPPPLLSSPGSSGVLAADSSPKLSPNKAKKYRETDDNRSGSSYYSTYLLFLPAMMGMGTLPLFRTDS